MNEQLMQLSQEPARLDLDAKELARYQQGLKLLALRTNADFLDLPVLADDRFATDGDFYTIPHLHDTTLAHQGTSRDLLVGWRVADNGSECPVRISFDFKSEKDYALNIHLQRDSGTKRIVLYGMDEDGAYSLMRQADRDALTFSSLFD